MMLGIADWKRSASGCLCLNQYMRSCLNVASSFVNTSSLCPTHGRTPKCTISHGIFLIFPGLTGLHVRNMHILTCCFLRTCGWLLTKMFEVKNLKARERMLGIPGLTGIIREERVKDGGRQDQGSILPRAETRARAIPTFCLWVQDHFDWDGRVRRDLANLPYPRSRSSARESQAYSFGDRVPDKK